MERCASSEMTRSKSVGEKMTGYYGEAGYDVLSLLGEYEAAVTPYLRWEQVNTHAGVPSNGKVDGGLRTNAATFGLANPFLSILEDTLAVALAALAILLPILAAGLVAVAMLFLWRRLVRLHHRLRGAPSPGG